LGQSSPYLRILPPGSRGIVPNVAEDKFLHDRTFNGVGIARKLATLRSGDFLVLAHDLSGLNDSTEASEYYPLWLIIPGATGLVTPARYQICATREDIPTDFGPQPFFTSQKVEPAKQPYLACGRTRAMSRPQRVNGLARSVSGGSERFDRRRTSEVVGTLPRTERRCCRAGI